MDVWWSYRQTGYYFSNRLGCPGCYQAQTHTHIYEIEDLPPYDKDGPKHVKYATKKDNIQKERGEIVMEYRNIAEWLEELNDRIGTSNSC